MRDHRPRRARIPLPGSPPGESVDLLDRSAASLRCASQCGDAAQRYVEAHLGALRAAAAVVAARSVPSRRSRPRSVWQGRRRAALERGAAISGAREADDLLRQAEVFLGIVADVLGAPRRDAVAAYLIPIGVGAAGGGRG
jgi:hypothetical protein